MTLTSPRLILATLAAAAALTSAGVAAAQPQKPHHLPERGGLLFGFGIGGGQMSCQSDQSDICNATIDGAGSFDVHIGGMISPRLALMGDAWVMYHTENNVTITHAITTLAAQYWLAPRLWLKGGVGGAVARAHYRGVLLNISDRTDSVPGIMGAVGYELLVGRKFAMDVQLKGGTGFYKDNQVRAKNAALIVGFNWY